jgi:hypothetical protein
MNPAEAGVEDYLGYLKSLSEAKAEYFLEGGQAVNFWAEYIDAQIQGRPMSPMRPFTSKDCDIWVSNGTWKVLKRDPAVRIGSSPADGQLGILTLSEEPPRVVDVLSSVYGIDVKDYPRLMQRALDDGTVRVIDPVYLFLSKCHCFLHLPQADRQDERHVRMMAMILPEYLTLLIAKAEASTISDRDLLKEIKLLKKISSSGPCRRAMQALGIEAQSLIPWDRLARSQSELLSKYAASQSDRNR